MHSIAGNTFSNCINYKQSQKKVTAMTENSAGLQILGVNKRSRDGMEVANNRIGMAVANSRDGMVVVNNRDGMVAVEVVAETALSSGAMTAATATTTTTIRNQFSAHNMYIVQMRSS
jgi:hypothetical protein